MECNQCGWDKIICESCHSAGGLRGWIQFNKEEIEDLLMNLDQCTSEGYLNYGDPAYSAMQKIEQELCNISNGNTQKP